MYVLVVDTSIEVDPTAVDFATITTDSGQKRVALSSCCASSGYTSVSVSLGSHERYVTINSPIPATVNLPPGITGHHFIIKNKGTGTVTVIPNGTEKLFSTSQIGSLQLSTGDAVMIFFDVEGDWSVV